jgi:hypothetical protein
MKAVVILALFFGFGFNISKCKTNSAEKTLLSFLKKKTNPYVVPLSPLVESKLEVRRGIKKDKLLQKKYTDYKTLSNHNITYTSFEEIREVASEILDIMRDRGFNVKPNIAIKFRNKKKTKSNYNNKSLWRI